MKTDRMLLMAIVAVVGIILGYVFLTGDNPAPGGADPKEDRSASAADPQARSPFHALGSRVSRDEELVGGGEGTTEFTVPSGIRQWEDMGQHFGRSGDAVMTLAQLNPGQEPIPGEVIRVPSSWVLSDEVGTEGGMGEGNEGRGSRDDEPLDDLPPSTGAGATGTERVPSRPTPRARTAPAASSTAAQPAPASTARSQPWASFLMEEGADSSGSGAAKSGAPRSGAPRLGSPGVPSAAPRSGHAYVIQNGDSLWSIAERAYGRGTRYREIYEANRNLLSSPDATLPVGKSLRIP